MSEKNVPQDDALRETLTKAIQGGLAGRYYQRLLDLAEEDAAAVGAEKLPDMKATAYIARRALSSSEAASAEVPLVFRRVHEHGDEAAIKGVELWKLDPATHERVPDSGLVIAIADRNGGLTPFGPFTEEDVQLAEEGLEIQRRAGISFDGPPGLAVVPQSMIDNGIE